MPRPGRGLAFRRHEQPDSLDHGSLPRTGPGPGGRPGPGGLRPHHRRAGPGRAGRSRGGAACGRPVRSPSFPGDVTDPAHRAALVAAAGDRLDLLVNNAGTLGASPLPALADYPPDELRAAFEVNVIAPIALTQLALPLLRASGGAVLNVTSDAAVEAYAGWGGYGAAKAALEQASNVLAAEELAVRVWWADPGDLRTDMHQLAFPGEDISDRPEPAVGRPGVRPARHRTAAERPVPGGAPAAGDVVTAERRPLAGVHPAARAGGARPARGARPGPRRRAAAGQPHRLRRDQPPPLPRAAAACCYPVTCSWSTPARRCPPRSGSPPSSRCTSPARVRTDHGWSSCASSENKTSRTERGRLPPVSPSPCPAGRS